MLTELPAHSRENSYIFRMSFVHTNAKEKSSAPIDVARDWTYLAVIAMDSMLQRGNALSRRLLTLAGVTETQSIADFRIE